MKTFDMCKHSRKVECYRKISDFTCVEEVKSKLTCGHNGLRKCSESNANVICGQPCGKTLPCKHVCQRTCAESCADCKICIELRKKEIASAIKEAEKKEAELEKLIRREKRQPFSQPVNDDSEFDSIKNLVLNFIKPEHSWYPYITKIERVVNPKLEQAWWSAKSKLFDPQRGYDRKFHGTGEDGVQNICFGNGFRLPDISKNNMFGQGVYFASDSSKSAQKIYTKDSNKLLLCNVLLGKALKATKAMNDLTPDKVRAMGYDSLYAPPHKGTVKNDEFVVYNPHQALPAYIIHYTANSTAVSPRRSLPVATGFRKTRRTPSRTLVSTDPYQELYHLAESRFYRLQNSTSLRIQYIDIVENPQLEARFNSKQAEFKRQGIPSDPILAFHGTNVANIDLILKNNFCLSKVARTAHGFGIYFSEQPEVSVGYADGCRSFLLCKLLLGTPGTNCKVSDTYLFNF